MLPFGSAPRVLLCSDGVTGMVDHAVLETILLDEEDPGVAAGLMVAAAVAAGGQDNATAIVVDVVGLTGAGGPMRTRMQPVSLEEKLGALP